MTTDCETDSLVALTAEQIRATTKLIYCAWNLEASITNEETLAERTEHARRVRWASTYNAVLNARHLANDSIPVAHETACNAAIHAHGPMPDEFKVKP